jgi:aldose 1-epimerase
MELIELTDGGALRAQVIAFGARLVGLWAPDREGRTDNVVLSFADPAEAAAWPNIYLGCSVGRVAGRIGGATFALDGQRYRLAANEGRNHLHGGGGPSFDRVIWELAERGPGGVLFRHASPDGENGYPGSVEASVRYELLDGRLRITYEATADAPTPISMTNHTYWNLGGRGSGTIDRHVLRMAASHYLELDAELIPTGRILPVEATPLDFRTPHQVGDRIQPLETTAAEGYDHYWALDPTARSGTPPSSREPVVTATDPISGRTLGMVTSEPGLVFYSGNALGRSGAGLQARSAFCLEASGYPDAVNHVNFPSVILRPTETYRQITEYRFSVAD